MDEDELRAAMRPPGSGASFVATRHGGLARLEPLTAAAAAWLCENVAGETSWDGDALVVETVHFPDLVDAAIADGLTFEREPLPN